MYKLQLLLAGDGLSEAVEAEAERWRSEAAERPELRLRWGVRIPDDPFASTAQGASSQSFSIDGFLEAAMPDTRHAGAFRELAEGAGRRLAGAIDPGRSAVVVGTEHDIFAGDRPILLLYALRRLPSLTHEQFCDHWLHRHAEFARATQAERGYRQFHADLDQSAEVAGAAGFGVSDLDGVAEGSYADVDDFRGVMARPEIAADAMEDEKRFIDHSRSAGAVTAARLGG